MSFGKHLRAAAFFLPCGFGKQFAVRAVHLPDKQAFPQTCLSGLSFVCHNKFVIIYDIRLLEALIRCDLGAWAPHSGQTDQYAKHMMPYVVRRRCHVFRY